MKIEIFLLIVLVIGKGNGMRVRLKSKQEEEDYRNKLLFMLSLDGKQNIESYIDNKNNTSILIDNATIIHNIEDNSTHSINTSNDTNNVNNITKENQMQNVTEPHLLYPVITNRQTSVISSIKGNKTLDIPYKKSNVQLAPLTIIPIISSSDIDIVNEHLSQLNTIQNKINSIESLNEDEIAKRNT